MSNRNRKFVTVVVLTLFRMLSLVASYLPVCTGLLWCLYQGGYIKTLDGTVGSSGSSSKDTWEMLRLIWHVMVRTSEGTTIFYYCMSFTFCMAFHEVLLQDPVRY
jgi:hypothetical protein